MLYSDTSRTGKPFAKDPSVIKHQGRFLLYYILPPYSPGSAPPNSPRGYGIGIAESRDLENWQPIATLDPLPGTAEQNGICAPGARVIGGRVHLFYQTYGNGARDSLCHAHSADGVVFERNPSNPVFAPRGAWCAGRTIDAEAFEHQGTLLLYYATRDPAMQIQMLGVAAADARSGFGRETWRDLSADGPLLRPTLPWEQDCIEAPTVCRHNSRLYLFYGGAYNCAPQQIGCAVSGDGVAWARLSDTPLLASGLPGTWNADESGHPGVFADDDGTYHLFFQGTNDGGTTWFLSRKRILWQPDGIPSIVD